MSKLISKIIKHKKLYYLGEPQITDQEYDSLEARLRAKAPDHPVLSMTGSPVPGKEKTTHRVKMGSLANAKDKRELKKWFNKMENTGLREEIHTSYKLDGASVELVYEKGHFKKAITRGDGVHGQDVTVNVLLSSSIPQKIDEKTILSVKAECVIFKDDFEKIKDDYANTRNAASGILGRHDSVHSNLLKIIAYSYTMDEDLDTTEYDAISNLEMMGFIVTEQNLLEEFVDLIEYVDKVEGLRESLDYEIDGVVCKINDMGDCRSLGMAGNKPKGQVAYKFTPRGSETVIEDVKVQIGQTGIMTPVALISPVFIGGSKIVKATLHNYDEVRRLKIQIGDIVEVVKGGDVIPKIVRLVKKGEERRKIKIPKICNSCGKDVIKEGAFVKCTNDECNSKLIRKLEHYVSSRNIMFLNTGVIRRMFRRTKIKYPYHLYKIKDLTKLKLKNGILGEARSTKILAEIDASRKCTVADFLASLGVDLLGKATADAIVEYFDIKTVNELLDVDTMSLVQVPGIGNETAVKFTRFFQGMPDHVRELIDELEFEAKEEGILSGKSFCLTGTLSVDRKEYERMIEEHGGSITGANGKLNYLVVGEKPGAGKLNKALNAEKIDEDILIEMIQGGTQE